MYAHFCFFRARSENTFRDLLKNCTWPVPFRDPSDAQRQTAPRLRRDDGDTYAERKKKP
jgi:hypothetical protein